MARMFPPSIECFEHEHYSEIEVYNFLESMLPDNYYVFWNIRVNNKYPDFIIVEPSLGIVVLEVKDWALGTISGADVKKYYFKPDGKSDLNPLEQARVYALKLQKILEQENTLCQSNGDYKGKLKVCYAYGVVFTNITQENFMDNPIYNSIDEDRILFKDEIEYIYHNKDINKLEQNLKNIFVPENSFKFDPLSKEDMELISQLLYKSSIIKPVKEDISDETYLSYKKPLHNKNNKLKTKKSLIQNLKNVFINIIKVILIIFTFFSSIVILAIITGYSIRGDLRSIKDVPILVGNFIEGYKDLKENKYIYNEDSLQPSLTFDVGHNPRGKGTFILIKDGNIYLTSKTFVEGSSIEFYDNKKVIIYDSKSNKEEFIIENDIIELEVANAYTKIYFEGEEYRNLKYFKYDFVNREIIK